MADISIPWKKITRGLSRGKRYANDRIPTLQEVRKIVEYPDRRIKPIVYTMCPSGIRLGAWDYLRWKHIIPISNDKNEIIAAKIRVYADEEEEYISFVSLETYSHLREWMNYRKEVGELVTERKLANEKSLGCNNSYRKRTCYYSCKIKTIWN